MVIHHRKPTDAHCEDFRQFFNPIFQPLLAIGHPAVEQKRAPDAACHAVIQRETDGSICWLRAMVIGASPVEDLHSVQTGNNPVKNAVLTFLMPSRYLV